MEQVEWVEASRRLTLASEDAKKVCSRFCLLANTQASSNSADCLDLGQKERERKKKQEKMKCVLSKPPHPSTATNYQLGLLFTRDV